MEDLLLKTNDIGFVGDNSLLENTKVEALFALGNLKFPTRKDEAWKYTSLKSVQNRKFVTGDLLKSDKLEDFKVADMEANVLVFVNGHYSEDQSTILENNTDKIVISSLKAALNDNNNELSAYFGQTGSHTEEIFTALNTVNTKDGVLITVKENTVIEQPIHIINITKGTDIVAHPRNLFVAGENSMVKIISSYETEEGSSFTNSATEIMVHKNAMLDYYVLQNESVESVQVNNVHVIQKDNTNFSITTITTDGGLVRNNLKIEVDGKHCETKLYGLYFLRGTQHVDNHTYVDHIDTDCMSEELYKGVMNDQSTGVFNGKVFVHREAQKTNAFQSNKNILMTDEATIYSKPELEIYADDVKCSHGSTTGQFDEEALFYLRARGIDETSARKLLVDAFASDVLNNINIPALKEKVEARVDASLN